MGDPVIAAMAYMRTLSRICLAVRQWFKGWGLAVRLLLGLLLGFAVSGCRTVGTGVASPPEPYLRIIRSNGTVALQVAVREMLPYNPRFPVIWLMGASHVGTSDYFNQLQQRLDVVSRVLYEGVGERLGQLGEVAQPNAEANRSAPAHRSFQTTLAGALGLEFQLSAINYSRAHFHNSDLTIGEIQQLLARQRRANQQHGTETEQEFDRMIGLMDGSSLWSLIAQAGLRVLEASPKLQGMMRLVLIETLGQVRGDLADIQGVSPAIQELMRVLIRERNLRVIRDVQLLLRQKTPPATIAIFYGAGHLDDLEKRLSRQGFHAGITEWHTAFSVNPAASGLSAGEITLVQTLVEYQLKHLLKQPARSTKQTSLGPNTRD